MKMFDSGSIMCDSMENNLLVFSRLHEVAHAWKGAENELGIKYVLSGEERYTINKKTHIVSEGTFLLVNKGQDHEIFLPYNPKPVLGLCMALNAKILNDVLINNTVSESWLLENGRTTEKMSFDFFEGIYKQDDILNQYIVSAGKTLNTETGKIDLSTEEFFYGLATQLLISQSLIRKQAMQISANQFGTQKELFKRVNTAKQMMDDYCGQTIEMADLAKAVAMSEFHFFRTYKQVYGISPKQYQIRKKLEKAKKLILESKHTITEIAFMCGFADVQSFSKAFKKLFGFSPVSFRK